MWIVGLGISSMLDVDCRSGPTKCVRCGLYVRAYQVCWMLIVGQGLSSMLDVDCRSGSTMCVRCGL